MLLVLSLLLTTTSLLCFGCLPSANFRAGSGPQAGESGVCGGSARERIVLK